MRISQYKLFLSAGLVRADLGEAAWTFYTEGTMSIEILKDDELQKIYFRVKDKVSISYNDLHEK